MTRRTTRPGTFRAGDDEPRRGRGPTKGAPNAGRPPNAFREAMRALASRPDVLDTLGTILANPTHPHWFAAWKEAADRGYGRPTAPVDITSGEKALATFSLNIGTA